MAHTRQPEYEAAKLCRLTPITAKFPNTNRAPTLTLIHSAAESLPRVVRSVRR